MNRMRFSVARLLLLCSGALCGSAVLAQQQPQTQVINITISRSIQTVNYRAAGSTRIDFRGTALLPQAKGEAKIESKAAAVTVQANFDNLSAASQFGPAYLTYVLWAVSPEGRANNLGQLILNGKKSKLQVTTRLQT